MGASDPGDGGAIPTNGQPAALYTRKARQTALAGGATNRINLEGIGTALVPLFPGARDNGTNSPAKSLKLLR